MAEGRKAKPRDNTQARISQALAKQHEAERRLADLEAQLAQSRQPQQQTERFVEKPASPPAGRSRPSEDEIGSKYATYADFVEELADWKAEQRIGNLDEVIERRLSQREEAKRRTAEVVSHDERMLAMQTSHPDYAQAEEQTSAAVRDAGLYYGPALAAAIVESPRSADMVYWLATHPTETLQLAAETKDLGVSAASIVRRLLEARLGAGVPSGSVSAALSNAKPPVRPVGVSSVLVPDEPGEDEPFESYFKRQNASDRKRGRL